MTFYQKVKAYSRLSNSTEQFGPEDPEPRMLIVLEDGTEIILEGDTCGPRRPRKPRWSFKVRTDGKAWPLGAKISVDDKFVRREKNGVHYTANQETVTNVELSGDQSVYEAYNKLLWEGFPENQAVVASGADMVIDELKQKRDRFLASLMHKQSIVELTLRDGKKRIGIYYGNDGKHIVLTHDGRPVTYDFLDTESMKKL